MNYVLDVKLALGRGNVEAAKVAAMNLVKSLSYPGKYSEPI